VNTRDRVNGFWRRLSWRWLPGCCVQCGSASGRDADLCAGCAAELPWNDACCAHCALPLPQGEAQCGRCQRSPPEFAAAYCPLRYAWPLDALVTRFKFSGDLAAGSVLAALLADRLETAMTATPPPDCVMSVPLHRERLRERGFNQALELARPLARRFGIVLIADGLRRERATPPQTGLTALRRRRNLRGAFAAVADVRGRHVALVDDVVTTAATVRECARTLRRAGAASVQVWAVARAPVGRGM
jgi:ComF family protein